MGANSKQKDSNILSAEAYTGQCPVQCEQCYVNFGQSGRAAPTAIARGKSPEAREAKKRAMRSGWDGKSSVIWRNPDREWHDRGPSLIRLRTGYVIPAILRVSTMGDSSISRKRWCQDIIDLWGDHCFFNSTIRILRTNRKNLQEVFHKVVVTANGGFQRPHMVLAPKGKREWPKTMRGAEAYVKAALGTMDPPSESTAFASFDIPRTLSQIGLADQEKKVKFYRLRSMPTIEPRLETDAPVVHTMLRLASVSDACEFARRYGLELRYEGTSAHHLEIVRRFGFDEQRIPGKKNRILIGTNSDWNTSEFKGEMSEYISSGAWWRMAGPHLVQHLPFVCDARKMGCKACGLCATLDGTEPGNKSATMSSYGFDPVPFLRTYVETNKLSRNPVEEEDVGGSLSEDFFGDILDEVFIRENPFGEMVTVEQDEGWIADALREISDYVVKLDYFVEGWNTHEDAMNLTGYCFWALLRKAKRRGLSEEEAWFWCRSFCDYETGIDIFYSNPEMMLAWGGEGWLVDHFGMV